MMNGLFILVLLGTVNAQQPTDANSTSNEVASVPVDAKDQDPVSKDEQSSTKEVASVPAPEVPVDAESNPSNEMTAMAMEAAMTDLMLGKSTFGATPMGGSVKKIENILVKTMLPKVFAAHNVDQRNLKKFWNQIGACGSTKAASLRKAGPALRKYNSESRQHKKCRASEAVLYTFKQQCTAQQRALYKEKTGLCKTFSLLSKKYGTQKDNRAIMNKAGGEQTEQYIKRISATVCGTHKFGARGQYSRNVKGGWGGGMANSILDKYLQAKYRCTQAKNRYNAKVKDCKNKLRSYKTKKGKCDQNQKLMDSNSCNHAIMVKDTCEAYSGCYFKALSVYKLYEKKAKGDEVDRRAEFRGLKRMQCIIKAFADGKVSDKEVNACKAVDWRKDAKYKKLFLKYKRIPPQKKCTTPSLYPATGPYKAKEFKRLPAVASGMECAPCAGMSVVNTKPRKGSPRGTKGERVALVGDYSAGALVKITNGLDVRRSLDKNSCPLGTKIFSPATRNDWKTFIASAKPLRAPHWIIDVTRPQNSCGGCTRNPMNSKNGNQKTWKTSDGSPWWLRSSRYSEPNGDYHANCYLDLWQTPRNENSVTFNDWNCGYHSKSYYCQPEHLDLKPKPGSPRSCQCSNVDLSGVYSAGVLVKCVNCLTVYKSSQKNSCPNGMKIFSPATRKDWKTFLASARPLRAPHWIIDVTRPQNGCGGCTRYPMKSTTRHQASWRTSDGSPWWLRNSRYGEPNGDYNANCFLDLWHTPRNADSVTFNDGRCHYRSRSYYCQPKKGSKNYGDGHRRRRVKYVAPPKVAQNNEWWNMADGGGWIKVRHVPAGNRWHKATDQLRGTDVYGSPKNDKVQWSIKFPKYDEFMFATGDGKKWLIADKNMVLGWYANGRRTITKSSTRPNGPSYKARWYRRHGAREDPWISLNDHGAAVGQGKILYGENSFGHTHARAVLPKHKGADVYVRVRKAKACTKLSTFNENNFNNRGNANSLISKTFTYKTSCGYTVKLSGWTHTRTYHKGFLRNTVGTGKAVVEGLQAGQRYKFKLYQYIRPNLKNHSGFRTAQEYRVNGKSMGRKHFSPTNAVTASGTAVADNSGKVTFTFIRPRGPHVHIGLSAIAIAEDRW